MTTGLPSHTQVIELLGGEFAHAGYEIEDVVIDSRTRPPRITVIVDGDTPLDLDMAAALSRSASALLDGLDSIRTRYSMIVKAVVQVEFSPSSQLELELAVLGRAVGTEAGA